MGGRSGAGSRARIRARFARGALAALVLAALAASASAQEVVRRNVGKLPFEDGAIVVDAHSDGQVVIGASHGDSTLAIPFPGFAVRDWADSTARLLALRPRRSRRERTYRSSVVNQNTGAGVSFTRHVVGDSSTYRLFFANAHYGGFPLDVSRYEANLLVRVLQKAVTVAGKMRSAASR